LTPNDLLERKMIVAKQDQYFDGNELGNKLSAVLSIIDKLFEKAGTNKEREEICDSLIMKVRINPREVDIKDPRQIALFQLLCSLSTARTCLALYMGEEAGRSNLPVQDDVIILAMSLAAIGESLYKFEELINNNIIQKPLESNMPDIEDAWKLIASPDAQRIKRTNLKYIRDKSSFHFDPEPIKQYFSETSEETDEIDLWEATETDEHGFSPLASLIILNTLMNVTKPDPSRAELSLMVYGALSIIVLHELDQRYNLKTG
jgi:hypothetical protein